MRGSRRHQQGVASHVQGDARRARGEERGQVGSAEHAVALAERHQAGKAHLVPARRAGDDDAGKAVKADGALLLLLVRHSSVCVCVRAGFQEGGYEKLGEGSVRKRRPPLSYPRVFVCV